MPNKDHTDFMLEEYRNIAATHDKLRDIIIRLFNYFLILAALPFTVAGIIVKNGDFDILSAPLSLYLLCIIVGIASFMLALAILDARLGQYRYAKTVNLVRKYFLDKEQSIKEYLYLPVSDDVPQWTSLGFVGWQVYFVIFLGGILLGYGIFLWETWWLSTVMCVIYWIIFLCAKKLLTTNYIKKYDLTKTTK